MRRRSGDIDIFLVFGKTNTILHHHPMHQSSGFDERPIKKVSVVRHENVWLDFVNMIEETLNQSLLVGFVENFKVRLELGFWTERKIFNVGRDDFPVCDQKSLKVEKIAFQCTMY